MRWKKSPAEERGKSWIDWVSEDGAWKAAEGYDELARKGRLPLVSVPPRGWSLAMDGKIQVPRRCEVPGRRSREGSRCMRVINKTRYSGVVLRSIFLAVVADVEKTIARDKPLFAEQRARFIRDRCQVTYVHTRGRGCSGHASYSGGYTRLRIQKGSVDAIGLIWLVRHEVYHLFNVRHEEMPSAVNHRTDASFAAVGELFASLIGRIGGVLAEIEPTKKPKLGTNEKRAAKLVSLDERIKNWESKARRAENALKKLQRQRRYYETALAPVAEAAKGPPA